MADPATYRWSSQIRFHQADPAGWMFYGAAFELAHDCFEDFVGHLEIPRKDWFESKKIAVPVRATQANYLAPLRAGDHFEIQMSLTKIGDSSLTAQFRFFKKDTLCLEIESTHVFMSVESQTKCPIPPEIKDRLLLFTHGSSR